MYQIAIMYVHHQSEDAITLTSMAHLEQGKTHTLTMSGFVRFSAGDHVALFISSSEAVNFNVRSTTSFTFHYMGM